MCFIGLDPGNRLFAGFLSEYDVSRRYRVNTPYISNPYQTMGRTSPAIARRYNYSCEYLLVYYIYLCDDKMNFSLYCYTPDLLRLVVQVSMYPFLDKKVSMAH